MGETPVSHHDLKCWPKFFLGVSGKKTFDARREADRRFDPGEMIIFREFEPAPEKGYTGNTASFRITYCLRDPRG